MNSDFENPYPMAFKGRTEALTRSRRSQRPGFFLAAALASPWLLAIGVLLWAHQPASSPLYAVNPYAFLLAFAGANVVIVACLLRGIRKDEAKHDDEQLLFHNARDGMLLVRVKGVRSGNLSFVVGVENPAAVERLKKYGQTQSFVGRSIEEAFPAWLAERTRQEYTTCVTSRRIHRYQISPPDKAVTHESVATPVLDPTGTFVTHIIVIMRDISERIRHEQELAAALVTAESANKSKSEFLASMSHELRTPLNAVLGYSELMMHGIGGALTKKQTEYLEYIHQSGAHLLNIISDILDLSKIEAGQFILHKEETNLRSLIDVCLLMLRERASAKGLNLAADIPPVLPTIEIDPLRLKQVILNLLSNAVKFTAEGSVTLSARCHAADGCVLTVSDTGVGMTPAELEIALQPFGQVESAFSRNHDGAGLGLPIAHHLVKLHGGQMTLESRKGYGTVVTVVLPLSFNRRTELQSEPTLKAASGN